MLLLLLPSIPITLFGCLFGVGTTHFPKEVGEGRDKCLFWRLSGWVWVGQSDMLVTR
jgi:hypothetical protein